MIIGLGLSSNIALRWMSLDLAGDKAKIHLPVWQIYLPQTMGYVKTC